MTGPVPFENNPSVAPQYLIPGNFPIASLSVSGTTMIATVTAGDAVFDTISIAPNFVIGQRVRFHIPNGYGMYQLDGVTGDVTAIDSSTYTISLNLPNTQIAYFNAFVPSPSAPYSYQKAQISAIGDNNNTSTGGSYSITNANLAPSGSFQNISPFTT